MYANFPHEIGHGALVTSRHFFQKYSKMRGRMKDWLEASEKKFS